MEAKLSLSIFFAKNNPDMVAIIASEVQKKELVENSTIDSQIVVWLPTPKAHPKTDVYIDLLFDNTPDRIELLRKIPAACIIVNYVAGTLAALPANFVRCNGWPSFINRNIIECAAPSQERKEITEKAFSILSKKVMFTPDVPGFISARIVAMIINEAYIALDEGVSTKAETDIAMKTGTNYPYGPFEWAEKIGITHVYQLLSAMAVDNNRYEPASLLKQEALTV